MLACPLPPDSALALVIRREHDGKEARDNKNRYILPYSVLLLLLRTRQKKKGKKEIPEAGDTRKEVKLALRRHDTTPPTDWKHLNTPHPSFVCRTTNTGGTEYGVLPYRSLAVRTLLSVPALLTPHKWPVCRISLVLRTPYFHDKRVNVHRPRTP